MSSNVADELALKMVKLYFNDLPVKLESIDKLSNEELWGIYLYIDNRDIPMGSEIS